MVRKEEEYRLILNDEKFNFSLKFFGMKKSLFLLSFLIGFALFFDTAKAVSFAPNDPGVNIGTHLDQGYEPSGVVWHNRTQSLFLIWDNGYVTQMDSSGTILHPSVRVGGDLEDITVVDDQTNFLYLLEEYPQKIVEFDISSWTKTGRSWTLQGMPGNSVDGAEALTYNPLTNEFYVGAQADGQIYVYSVDLQNSGSVNFSRMIPTGVARDIAGLQYSFDAQKIYAVFDASNQLKVYDARNDTLVAQYDVPGFDQEGVTVLPGCPGVSAPIIIAEDSGRVMKYESYPLVCPLPSETDADHDGFMADVDCNDQNAAVYPRNLELINDGIDNDCNSRTPDSVKSFDVQQVNRSRTASVREDYTVFDAAGEFASVTLPARMQGAWYLVELESRTNTVDGGLFHLGVAVPQIENIAQTKTIDSTEWKTYSFYNYIPANKRAEIQFVTDVSGRNIRGVKREVDLRRVTVTRLEVLPNILNRLLINELNANTDGKKANFTLTTNLETSGILKINRRNYPNTVLSKTKSWAVTGLVCGTTYPYQVEVFPDMFDSVRKNSVVQNGQVVTAACR